MLGVASFLRPPVVVGVNNTQDSQGMVSCEDYQDCFDYDALADVNNCLNGGTHGPVHIKVGGEWDDPEQDIIQALCECRMCALRFVG